jgi:hypothetical protein
MKPVRFAVLLAFALFARPGVGAAVDFGIVTLDAGTAKTVSIGGSGRMLRVCNEANSAGSVLVTIGDNAPHYLESGLCAEDVGERLTFRSLGASATVDYKANCDSASMD